MAASSSSPAAAAVGRAVEEVRSALNEHADVVAELFGRVSTELRGGFGPAVDTFVGFFHAVDWKVRTLVDRHDKFPCHSATGNHHLQEEHQFPTYLVSFNIFWCIPCRENKHVLRTKLEELLKPELL
uniref:Uncharacterized protein n=1 Tax=Aegilops tauschii subsp. strangulata TaxID=200361 RepID=A0A453S3A5_AEGTS